MSNKSTLTRQELLAFFHDIMKGDSQDMPTMEQRMKAATTLMMLLEKHPQEDEGALTFTLTPDQINQMRQALYDRWEGALGERSGDAKNKESAQNV
jgi:hypothetical protein